jgi:hypothetical protein
MDDESLKKLRLDKRLIGRRGWISDDQLQSALDELPDASDKIAPPTTSESDESPSDGPA